MKKKILEFSEMKSGLRKQFWESYPITQESVELVSGKEAGENFLIEQSFDAAVVDGSYSGSFMDSFTSFPVEVLETRCVTAVIRDGKRWWPRCFLPDALTTMIVRRAGALDTKRKVYLVGTSATAVACLVTLVKMGFGEFCIFSQDLQEANSLKNFLQQKFFNLDIECMDITQLLTRGNDGGVLVNTISHSEAPTLIEDLSYLNFLLEKSLVIDCNLDILNKHLFDEVQRLNHKLVQGLELAGAGDILLLQALQVLSKSDSEAYFTAWQNFLQQNNSKV